MVTPPKKLPDRIYILSGLHVDNQHKKTLKYSTNVDNLRTVYLTGKQHRIEAQLKNHHDRLECINCTASCTSVKHISIMKISSITRNNF